MRQAFPQPLVEEENLSYLWQQTLEGISIDIPWLDGSRIVVDHEQLLELVHLKPSQVLPSSSVLCAPNFVLMDPASDINLYQVPFRFEDQTAVSPAMRGSRHHLRGAAAEFTLQASQLGKSKKIT